MKKFWFNKTFGKQKKNTTSIETQTTSILIKDAIIISDLSDDIGGLLETSENYDVLIYAGEEDQDIQEFKTHSQILSARSPYFRAALSSRWAKKEGNTFIFKKPNISPDIFK